MDSGARLRAAIELLPAGSAVTLPREALLAALEVGPDGSDLALPEVARRFDRSVSTVRSWCERGLLPGAYRLRGRAWQVPLAAIAAFRAAEAERGSQRPTSPARVPRRRPADLSAWRSEVSE